MFKNKYRVAVDYFKKRTELEKILLILVLLALFIVFIYALPTLLDLSFKVFTLILVIISSISAWRYYNKLEEVYKNLNKLKQEVRLQISEIIDDESDRVIIYMKDGQKVKALRANFADKLNYYEEISKYIEDKNNTTLNLINGAYLETLKTEKTRNDNIKKLLSRQGLSNDDSSNKDKENIEKEDKVQQNNKSENSTINNKNSNSANNKNINQQSSSNKKDE